MPVRLWLGWPEWESRGASTGAEGKYYELHDLIMLQWFPFVKMTFTVTQTCSNYNSSVCDSVSVQLWEVLISLQLKSLITVRIIQYHCGFYGGFI